MSLVTYEMEGTVAVVTMDDGKANALSPEMFAELNEAFDRADADGVVVVLSGRPGRFSGGFDLAVLQEGGRRAAEMLVAGFRLSARMLGFGQPIVVACPGHAIAMGAFLMLSADVRIGVAGDFKIGANEVAIGLPFPWSAAEVCRQRINPAFLSRAVITAELFAPADAVTAGFLDEIVAPEDLFTRARDVAGRLAALDRNAYRETKSRLRAPVLAAVHAGLERDEAMLEALLA